MAGQAALAALLVLPFVLTPGVSFALVTQRVISDGRQAALPVALGTACGQFAHASAAALGLSALVASSSLAFSVVKFAGAAYLLFLGVRLLRREQREADAPRRLPWTGHGGFRQGLLSNLLNPKTAAIYLSVLPQLLRPGQSIVAAAVLLTVVHSAMQVSWLLVWGAVIARLRSRARSLRFRQRLRRVSGGALVILAGRTALDTRG